MGLEAVFDEAVAGIRSGQGVFTETGLDEDVTSALLAYAIDPFDNEALGAARKALEGPLSGENARRRAAILRAAFDAAK